LLITRHRVRIFGFEYLGAHLAALADERCLLAANRCLYNRQMKAPGVQVSFSKNNGSALHRMSTTCCHILCDVRFHRIRLHIPFRPFSAENARILTVSADKGRPITNCSIRQNVMAVAIRDAHQRLAGRTKPRLVRITRRT